MINRFAFLLCLGLLNACSSYLTETRNVNDEGYFADATDCYHSSMIKTQLNVPVGGISNKEVVISPQTMVIEVPITQDAGTFKNCMSHAGHQPPKADPQAYLEMSSRCLGEARNAENPDQAYGRCIRRGNISVETINEEEQ